MNEADIDLLDAEIRAAMAGSVTNQELRAINFLLQKILIGQAQINARLDDIQRTINPQKWERDHPEEYDDLTSDMF